MSSRGQIRTLSRFAASTEQLQRSEAAPSAKKSSPLPHLGNMTALPDVINVSRSVLHELDLRCHTFIMSKATALLWAEIETRHDCRLADQVREIRPVGTIGQAPNTL